MAEQRSFQHPGNVEKLRNLDTQWLKVRGQTKTQHPPEEITLGKQFKSEKIKNRKNPLTSLEEKNKIQKEIRHPFSSLTS